MPGTKQLTGKVEKTALKMLATTTQILDDYKIKYVLDFGTLLGIIRESRLLPWDSDLDISIAEDDVEEFLKIKWKMWLAGYRIKLLYFKRDTGPYKKGEIRIIKIQERLLLILRKHSMMDVFVKRKNKNEYSYVVGANHSYLKTTPKKFHESRTQITFKEKKYSIPKDYDGYLTYVYGDWRKPVKEGWDFRESDNCTREIYRFQKKGKNPFAKLFVNKKK